MAFILFCNRVISALKIALEFYFIFSFITQKASHILFFKAELRKKLSARVCLLDSHVARKLGTLVKFLISLCPADTTLKSCLNNIISLNIICTFVITTFWSGKTFFFWEGVKYFSYFYLCLADTILYNVIKLLSYGINLLRPQAFIPHKNRLSTNFSD